jgi:propanol-preferring alcohol dehydrogenase
LAYTGVTPAQAAVTTDAVLTAYHAVKTTGNVKPTETVLIFGLGGLGFNALQIVLAIGARVIVTDKREEVLAEAIKFGVPKEDVIPIGKNAVEFVQERGLVVDVVIDFVGVNETFTASQELGERIQHWFLCFGIGLLTSVQSDPLANLCKSAF